MCWRSLWAKHGQQKTVYALTVLNKASQCLAPLGWTLADAPHRLSRWPRPGAAAWAAGNTARLALQSRFPAALRAHGACVNDRRCWGRLISQTSSPQRPSPPPPPQAC